MHDDLRCPLCEAPLAFPPGTTDPKRVLDVLERHFEDCPAIRVPRPLARTPEHRHDKPRETRET
jgi:hypothetical protein